jgi:hypothetical protein
VHLPHLVDVEVGMHAARCAILTKCADSIDL